MHIAISMEITKNSRKRYSWDINTGDKIKHFSLNVKMGKSFYEAVCVPTKFLC